MPFQPGQSGNPMGRKPGVKDLRVRSLDKAIADVSARIALADDGTKLDAHGVLVRIYQEPEAPLEMRLLAARAALKVERPALSAVAMSGDLHHHVSIADQLARARRREIVSSGPVIEAEIVAPADAEIAA